jgi:lipopolysaccharide/colanic/teichoic acid biosynthesis glycosyltransferase
MSLTDQGSISKRARAVAGRHAAVRKSARRPRLPPLAGRKTYLDIAIATFALIALSPLFLFVAILLRLTDPGPVFFGHKRVGLGGRSFRCLKFRTMCTDADAVLQRLLATDPEAAAEWQATRKLRHDPRISRVGRVLRAYSVDELPQLINVIRGEMSLVGPRPVVTSRADALRQRGGALPVGAPRDHRPVAGERAQRHDLCRTRRAGCALRRGVEPQGRRDHPSAHRPGGDRRTRLLLSGAGRTRAMTDASASAGNGLAHLSARRTRASVAGVAWNFMPWACPRPWRCRSSWSRRGS